MTDLLPSTTELPEIPTLDMPVVRASHRRYGPTGLPRPVRLVAASRPVGSPRPGPVPVRARRGTGRGRSFAVALAVTDALLAMFLLGTSLSGLWPSDLADRSASRSSVPSSVAVPPATGGGEPVVAHAGPHQRPPGDRDGGVAPGGAATTRTTDPSPVVPDAAPTRGQTPTKGPVGGPASTSTTVASVASTLPPEAPPDSVPSSVPETSVPVTEPQPPDTTPPPDTTLLPMETP